MKILKTIATLLFFVTFFSQHAHSQELYDLSESAVKAYFWKSKDPNTKVTEVPEKYKENSAVIIHQMSEEEWYHKRKKGIRMTSLFHFRIKLQDQAALEEYSEIYFPEYTIGGMGAVVHKYFRGVKIIKPDGTEKIINVKEEGVVDKSGRRKRLKLAMPGLEVGDIIDFYKFLYHYTYNTYFYGYQHVDREPLKGEYPVLNYSLKIHTDENWRIEFHNGNGAPELSYKKEGDGYLFSLEYADMEAQKSYPWYYPVRSTPYFKLYAKNKLDYIKDRVKEGKKPYITKLIRDEMVAHYRPYYEVDPQSKNEYRAFNRYLEKLGKSGMAKAEKLEAYYYYLRHLFKNKYLLMDEYNNNDRDALRPVAFTGHVIRAIQDLEMDYQVLVVMKRSDGKIDEMLNVNEAYYVIRVNDGDKEYYLYQPDEHTRFNRVPGTIEGTTAYALDSPDEKSRNLTWKNTTIPVSSHTDNNVTYTTEVEMVNPTDPLKIKGTITTKGLSSYSYQANMLNAFDVIEVENGHYGTTLWRDIDNPRDKVFYEKINQMKSDFSKEREEYVKGRLESDFEDSEVELNEVTLNSTGHWWLDKEFSFSYDCTVDDLVKKIGPNYLLQAGKLVGGQVEIEEDEKWRNVDVNMLYARSFNYTVNIKIPEGYTAEGLENFDFEVENETGGFVASATQQGNKIVMKLHKYYAHNHEIADEWGKMVAYLDAAYDFTEQKILLRKK